MTHVLPRPRPLPRTPRAILGHGVTRAGHVVANRSKGRRPPLGWRSRRGRARRGRRAPIRSRGPRRLRRKDGETAGGSADAIGCFGVAEGFAHPASGQPRVAAAVDVVGFAPWRPARARRRLIGAGRVGAPAHASRLADAWGVDRHRSPPRSTDVTGATGLVSRLTVTEPSVSNTPTTARPAFRSNGPKPAHRRLSRFTM